MVNPTISALMASNVRCDQVCCYCGQPHDPDSCRVVTSSESRRQILQKSGRCVVCLRKGHVGRNCRSSYEYCQVQWETPLHICAKTFTNASPTRPNHALRGIEQQQLSVSTAPSVCTPSLLMYVESHTPVLLQTALITICNP